MELPFCEPNEALDSDPPNYQNVSKMHILLKYAYNTHARCHFSIKKNLKKNRKIKKLKFYFLLFFLEKENTMGVWVAATPYHPFSFSFLKK